jgi:hypothetical protein
MPSSVGITTSSASSFQKWWYAPITVTESILQLFFALRISLFCLLMTSVPICQCYLHRSIDLASMGTSLGVQRHEIPAVTQRFLLNSLSLNSAQSSCKHRDSHIPASYPFCIGNHFLQCLFLASC